MAGLTEDKLWDFNDDKFSDIGESGVNAEIDSLSINHCGISTHNPPTTNGKDYNNYLNLEWGGSNSSYSCSFEASKGTDIFIAAGSTTAGRVVLVINEFGYVIEEITLKNGLDIYHVYYEDDGDKLFIRSQDSAVRVYAIGIHIDDQNNEKISKSWNFSDPIFNNCSSTTPNQLIDGLKLNGSPAYALNFNTKTRTRQSDGKVYNRSLFVRFGIIPDEQNISFTAQKGDVIKITMCSNVDVTRRAIVVNKHGYLLGNFILTGEPQEFVVEATCDNEDIYILSLEGLVSIQEITINE